MGIITKIVLAFLFGLLVTVGQFLPANKLTGRILSIEKDSDQQLVRNAVVDLPRGEVTAQIYESDRNYQVGERVILYENPQTQQLTVADYARTKELAQLLIIFLIVVLLVSGLEGLRSLVGLLISFGLIFAFVLPQIKGGANPLLVTMIAGTLTIFLSYYLTHGFNLKTTVAIFGTSGSLLLTGIIATIYANITKLTGLGSEEATFLIGQIGGETMKNILLSGMIIGTLGVLDDVTISQASVVQEIHQANEKLGMWQLFSRGMRVGRDHIASVVNTLVLVYAGVNLPLLLLFVESKASFVELINYEAVAEEIVRTLVGSIGLVSAVPLTTLLASYLFSNKKRSLFFD